LFTYFIAYKENENENENDLEIINLVIA